MSDMTHPGYQPGRLLNALREKFGVRSDRALSTKLDVAPPNMCRIRNRKIGISAEMWIVLSEATGLKIAALRELAGLPPRMYIQR
jgi:plasmid maintenance system antidote protein VapI